jgi:hypothetical protein
MRCGVPRRFRLPEISAAANAMLRATANGHARTRPGHQALRRCIREEAL